LDISAEKITTLNAVKKHIITHAMLLAAVALGALLDMKPASANNFTNLIFTLAFRSTSLYSYQTACCILPS
jgi:hypothetical protein